MLPPKKNRRANWCHFASRRADKLTLTFKVIYLSSKKQSPNAVASQTGIKLTVTTKLDALRFISSQLAQDAKTNNATAPAIISSEILSRRKPVLGRR